MKPPKRIEFEAITHGRKRAWINPSVRDAVAGALFEQIACEPAGNAGRGEVYRFPAGDGGHGILRKLRRGGVIRHFLPKGALLTCRPLHELQLHARIYAMGLPVPEPLGAVWERHGVWGQGAIATRMIDAVHLLDFAETNPEKAPGVLERTGMLICRMHDFGVYHADLQVKNILIDAVGTLYLIDFDKAVIRKRLTQFSRARNLLRFRRSLEKHGFPPDWIARVWVGYGVSRPGPRWLDWAYRARGFISNRFTSLRRHA